MGSHAMINVAILILRIAVGVIFMTHGMQKLFGAFGGRGIDGFAAMLGGLGFAAPLFWAWVAAIAEGVGGFFLLLGVIPRISAGLIAVVMLVAIAKVHGLSAGSEYQLLILATCVALMLTGGGKFSLFNKF